MITPRSVWMYVRIAVLCLVAGTAIGETTQRPPKAQGSANVRTLLVQTTTSTQDSGLMGHLSDSFSNADVVLSHAQPDEEKLVADGYGIKRFDVMYNDFVLIGPVEDPARIAGSIDVVAALKAIAEAKAAFASRGDDSGTHKVELALWKRTGVDIKAASGTWYRETGSGQGPTLNIAIGLGAYALTDRGTWISFKNKGSAKIVVEGDGPLLNQYGVILVNPVRYPHVKAAEGQAFIDWLIGTGGQAAIAAYKIDGQQLFFPNAKKSGS
jgi:tungstate transport system substrate-binding protein